MANETASGVTALLARGCSFDGAPRCGAATRLPPQGGRPLRLRWSRRDRPTFRSGGGQDGSAAQRAPLDGRERRNAGLSAEGTRSDGAEPEMQHPAGPGDFEGEVLPRIQGPFGISTPRLRPIRWLRRGSVRFARCLLASVPGSNGVHSNLAVIQFSDDLGKSSPVDVGQHPAIVGELDDLQIAVPGMKHSGF